MGETIMSKYYIRNNGFKLIINSSEPFLACIQAIDYMFTKYGRHNAVVSGFLNWDYFTVDEGGWRNLDGGTMIPVVMEGNQIIGVQVMVSPENIICTDDVIHQYETNEAGCDPFVSEELDLDIDDEKWDTRIDNSDYNPYDDGFDPMEGERWKYGLDEPPL